MFYKYCLFFNTQNVCCRILKCTNKHFFSVWKIRISVLLVALYLVTFVVIMYVPLTSTRILNETLQNDSTVQEVFVPRTLWNGQKPLDIAYEEEQALLVIIKHTGGRICVDFKSCSKRVREIQREDMTVHKMVDIEYNFLIGGDGRVYVGRDWNVLNEGWPRTIDIAFIGNFTENLPTTKMLVASQQLIGQGAAMGPIDFTYYSIVCHNQTQKTDSPGVNLFREVLRWDSYSSRRIELVKKYSQVQEMFISRTKWNGKKPLNMNYEQERALLVIVKHTGGKVCFNLESCSKRVREIQDEDMNVHKMIDIEYNFLIGGDGNVYVGRGWYVRNEGWPATVDIAFIGNFTEYAPTEKMIAASQQLIAQGAILGPLDFRNFLIVCHNQTEKTDSPGQNLFREVLRWINYSPEKVELI